MRFIKNILFLKATGLFFIIICGNSTVCSSQSDTAQLYQKFLQDSIKIATPKIVRPQFRFDTRSTLFENHRINMYGYDAGILVKNKLRLTLGYYRIDENLSLPLNGAAIRQRVFIRCGTINTELIYFQKRFLSLGFPLELGVGYYELKNIDPETRNATDSLHGAVAFSNFGLAGTFTPIRWFGLKVIAGYRKAVLSSNKQFDFNGVFSSIGLNVDLHEAIKDIKMYRLKKRYYKDKFRPLETFTDLLVE